MTVKPSPAGLTESQKLREDVTRLAEKNFGDRRAPLTDNERMDWYENMGVCGWPTKRDYKNYLSSNSSDS